MISLQFDEFSFIRNSLRHLLIFDLKIFFLLYCLKNFQKSLIHLNFRTQKWALYVLKKPNVDFWRENSK